MSLRRLGLAVALLGALTACRKEASPSADPAPGPGTPPETGPTQVASFTAEQLHKAYRDDPNGMNAKYRGKQIEVKGQVRYLDVWNNKKSAHVQLVGDPTQAYHTVGCRTTDTEPWKTLLPGHHATIVGTFDPIGKRDPSLTDARITRVEGAPDPPVEVGTVYAALEADPMKFEATYATPHGKQYTFLGRFVKTAPYLGSSTCWVLEGPPDAKLEMTFSPLLANPPAVPKAGQEIKFVSSCDAHAPKHEIQFPNVMVVSVRP
jgi:hypothetical protein